MTLPGPPQGFPDYHVFCAKVGIKTGRWVRNQTLVQRYQMIGNAVCPAVAAALGRCLALAAVGESPPGQEFISVPDEEYDEVRMQACMHASNCGLSLEF